VGAVTVDDVVFSEQKRIFHPKGDIYHVLKKSAAEFTEFGEAYFTTIVHGETKGWKRHTRMQMNLVVPVGTVRFYVRDSNGHARAFEVGSENYGRLTVPAGLWMAFHGVGTEQNLVLNIASIEHDPAEAENVPLTTFPLESS